MVVAKANILMKRIFMKFICVFFILCALNFPVQAQFLPDNKNLNTQSIERWMKSAEAMAPAIEVIDSMFTTDETLRQFDELSAVEQDKKIHDFLLKQNQWDQAMEIARQYGWKSPGEFRRLGTRLGNAIAAYFVKKDQQGLNPEQLKQLRDKTDPVVLAVPESDIEFVQRNEKQLQQFIQAYGK